jgi:outer membrane protein assembly factor BamA
MHLSSPLLCTKPIIKCSIVLLKLNYILCSAVFLFLCNFTIAQPLTSSAPVTDTAANFFVKDIIIKGNKKTKDYIILREMQFAKGDSVAIATFNKQLEQAKTQIYNTTLFSEIKAEYAVTTAYDIIVVIDVKERWYVYPVPQFKLVDRNFNEWIKTYNASLKRTNYGLKFVHYNLSGRRDQLRIFLLNGFSRDFSFSYNAPYSNKKLSEGFVVGAGYSQKKEIAYKTTFTDSLLFYTSDPQRTQFIGSVFYVDAGYSMRKGFFNRHNFFGSYSYQTISDSIALPKYNPNYFGNGKTNAHIIELNYSWQYTNVNNVLYATSGKTAFVGLTKKGLGFTGGINSFTAEASYTRYFDMGKNWYSSIGLNGKMRLPLQQAYINQRGLGYGDTYLRGLEYLVIDGVATAFSKFTLKKKLAAFKIKVPFKLKSLSYIPFTFFGKVYGDAGYAYNKPQYATNLNNKLLYTGGFGIDILTFYDLNLRLEYSFNQLGQKGLFLHTQGGF